MDWLHSVQSALNYIEAHLLDGQLDSSSVARSVYSSNMNFQRVFSIVTGITVADYIRNRRLTLAGEDLSRFGLSVIDAALKYGYDTPESFTKAFTRFHGINPSRAKRSSVSLKRFTPIFLKFEIEGGFNMKTNLIPYIHPVISDNAGENYWFNGCARYAMEGTAIRDGTAVRTAIPALNVGRWPLPEGKYDPAFDALDIPHGTQLFGMFNERYQQLPNPDAPLGLVRAETLSDLTDGKYCLFQVGAFRYAAVMADEPVAVTIPGYDCGELADYDLFAGITGDNFAQIWAYGGWRGCAASDYLVGADYKTGSEFIKSVFGEIGYSVDYISEEMARADRDAFVRKVIEYIDSGCPVISSITTIGTDFVGLGCDRVVVGYEDGGNMLLTIRHEQTVPQPFSLDEALAKGSGCDWIFVGQKLRDVDLKQVYRDAIMRLPKLLTMRTDDFAFGAQAFREWANYVESHTFTEEDFKTIWWNYTNYVCVVATNGSCCHPILQKAMELNPDFAFLSEISVLYQRLADMWNRDEDSLEALGGGFNVTLEIVNEPASRAKIAAKIREMADTADEILRVLVENLDATALVLIGNTKRRVSPPFLLTLFSSISTQKRIKCDKF